MAGIEQDVCGGNGGLVAVVGSGREKVTTGYGRYESRGYSSRKYESTKICKSNSNIFLFSVGRRVVSFVI